MNIEQYYFEGYKLTLRHESYLVEVQRLYEKPTRTNHIEEIPSWAFQSRLAIWLTDESATIQERSIRGDQIRKLFLAKFVKEKASAS